MSRRPASKPARSRPRGSFADFESLFEHLGRPAIIELGNPLPQERFLPKVKGLATAQINHLLLDRNHSDGDHGSR